MSGNPATYYRPKSVNLTSQYYKEAIENAASYNGKINSEKKGRMPFLDSQTGVAQNHISFWVKYRHRKPGNAPGRIYSYPALRYLRKRRAESPEPPKLSRVTSIEAADIGQNAPPVENPIVRVAELTKEGSAENSKDTWYEEYEEFEEPPDAGEIDGGDSGDSDYEDSYSRRRKKKAKSKSTKPPLKKSRTSTRHMDSSYVEEEERSFSVEKPERKKTKHGERATPSSYCDFCLGDEVENKKTGRREELVSCGDCGRSGHPSCLQFTANMLISVKNYKWQCIECKTCSLCGTSENDDQLLFCDDCDRGYHMYCLTPPLSEPPEGSWSCHLCLVEFHGGKKPAGML